MKKLALLAAASALLITGTAFAGAQIRITNMSRYTLNLDEASFFKGMMNSWPFKSEFPSIAGYAIVYPYIDFDFSGSPDAAGTAYYQVACPPLQPDTIEFHATVKPGWTLNQQVYAYEATSNCVTISPNSQNVYDTNGSEVVIRPVVKNN